jgi:dienelactone hydrolase
MSTGVGMSSCCLSGAVNSGTPRGREDIIGGLDTYISEPEGGSTAKTVIFLVDVFGWKFLNVRLLADNYAKAGFAAYIPDLHQGDSLPVSFLQNVEPPLKDQEQAGLVDKANNMDIVGTTLGPWLVKHGEAVSQPLVDGFVNTVRQIPGTQKIGAIGFCWGGRYAILQAHGKDKTPGETPGGGVDAAYACHPSLVAIPGDFEPVDVPLSLALGDHDSLLDAKSVEQIKEVMEKKSTPSEVRVYQDQVHGFALRSDWSSEKDKKAMDEAEKQGIEWFEKYLS